MKCSILKFWTLITIYCLWNFSYWIISYQKPALETVSPRLMSKAASQFPCPPTPWRIALTPTVLSRALAWALNIFGGSPFGRWHSLADSDLHGYRPVFRLAILNVRLLPFLTTSAPTRRKNAAPPEERLRRRSADAPKALPRPLLPGVLEMALSRIPPRLACTPRFWEFEPCACAPTSSGSRLSRAGPTCF